MGGAVFLLLCAGGTRVEAQGVASSFDQLAVLVQPGDKITVVDVAGREPENRIGKLSRDTFTLLTPAGPQDLGEVDVVSEGLLTGEDLAAVADARVPIARVARQADGAAATARVAAVQPDDELLDVSSQMP